MTEKTDHLETQLDALADQCADDGATGAPSDGDATNEPADDLAGSEFADQVQKMLDEATANLDGSGMTKSVDRAHDDESTDETGEDEPTSSAGATVPRTEPAVGDSADDEVDGQADQPSDQSGDDALIHQIDSMLADAADAALVGDFESVDEMDPTEGGELPADPASFVTPDELETDAESSDDRPTDATSTEAAADGMNDHPPGAFESVDEVADADASVDDADAAALSEGAAAVAAELDAEEQLQGDFECPTETLDDERDDEPVIETAGGTVEPTRDEAVDGEVGESATGDGEGATIAEAEPAPPPSPVIVVMAKINRPIDGLSEPMKNAVGVIAIGTLGMALTAFLIAGLGKVVGFLAGLVVMTGLTGGAVYALFLRTPGDGGDDPESI